jgi:hypothetical protein
MPVFATSYACFCNILCLFLQHLMPVFATSYACFRNMDIPTLNAKPSLPVP